MNKESPLWPNEVSVGEVVYPPGSSFGPRRQSNLQLMFVHTGHVTIWIDGCPHHIPAKSALVLYPDHNEHFLFAEECETYHTWLHAYIPQLDPSIQARFERLEWPLPLSPAMQQLIHDALALRLQSFPTKNEILKALVVQMLWRYIGEGEQRLTYSIEQVHPAVEQAQHFIQSHLHEPLTLELIAKNVAMSPAHLIRLFQKQMHITPMAYVWERRIAKGVELLEQTGLAVGIIAERCGFQSRFHFSRRIRESLGYTPLEVRRRSWQKVQ